MAVGVPAPGGANGLGVVFDDGNAGGLADVHQGIHVGHLTKQVDGHDGLRSWGDGGANLLWVDGEGVWIHVKEHRFGPHQGNHFHRGDEGETSGDYFVARPDIQRHQGNLQGVGAVSTGNHMLRSGKFSQLVRKSRYFRAFDEGARRHDAANGFVEFRLDFGMLADQVDHVDFLIHHPELNFKNTPAQRGYLPNDSKKLTPHW